MNSPQPSRQLSQRTAFGLLGLATIVVIAAVSFIIIYIIANGAGAIDWAFLTQPPTEAGKAGGIFPALVGTFLLMLGTVLFSLPIGVSAGIYLAEYARDNRLTRFINLAILSINLLNITYAPPIDFIIVCLFITWIWISIQVIPHCILGKEVSVGIFRKADLIIVDRRIVSIILIPVKQAADG